MFRSMGLEGSHCRSMTTLSVSLFAVDIVIQELIRISVSGLFRKCGLYYILSFYHGPVLS